MIDLKVVMNALLSLLVTVGCTHESPVRTIQPHSQAHVAWVEGSIRDAILSPDCSVGFFGQDGDMVWIRSGGGGWADPEYAEFGDSLPNPRWGVSFVRGSGGALVWIASDTAVHHRTTLKERFLHLSISRPEELWVGSSYPQGPPRNHGKIELIGTKILFERRNIPEQYESLTTIGFLSVFDPGRSQEDTLVTFPASAYSHRKGELVLCCGRPLIFSPEAQWLVDERGRVVFTDGISNEVSIINPQTRSVLNRISFPAPTHEPTEMQFEEYAVREGHFFQEWSTKEERRYRQTIGRRKSALRSEFFDFPPIITQMVEFTNSVIGLRQFDPGVWPHGLSDKWILLDLVSTSVETVSLPGLGTVHDLIVRGGTLRILSSVRRDSNRRELVIMEYPSDDLTPMDHPLESERKGKASWGSPLEEGYHDADGIAPKGGTRPGTTEPGLLARSRPTGTETTTNPNTPNPSSQTMESPAIPLGFTPGKVGIRARGFLLEELKTAK